MSWSSTTTPRATPTAVVATCSVAAWEPKWFSLGVFQLAHVERADLILVDFRLEHWVGPRDLALENLPAEDQLIAGRPGDGRCAR